MLKRSIPLLTMVCAFAFQRPTAPANSAGSVADAFRMGWMLVDTNGDGIADFVNGKLVVPSRPSAAENTAATNLAARLGFGTTGLTLPMVVNAGANAGISSLKVGEHVSVASHSDIADVVIIHKHTKMKKRKK